MRKVLVIAIREYLAVVRSKAFLVSLVLLPLMMFAPHFIERLTRKIMDVNDRRFAIIDRTPSQEIYPRLERAVAERNRTIVDAAGHQTEPRFVLEKIDPAPAEQALAQRFDLAQQIRAGKLFGILEIGRDVFIATPDRQAPASSLPDEQIVQYQTNTPTYGDFKSLADDTVNEAVRNRKLIDAGVPPQKLRDLRGQVKVVNKALPFKDASGIHDGKDQSQIVTIMVPLGLAILMMIVVMIGGIPMMQGVIEEKQQRIAEVLLGSVSPFQLMAGKVLGIVATSATLIFVYLGGAYFVAQQKGYAHLLPAGLLGWFVVFALLSVLMYGSIYIAIGAAVSDTREMQSLMLPVQLVMVLPLMILVNVIQNPNGPLARLATWFPPATPMISIARLAVPPGMPVWETLLAILVVLAATTFFVWASGRIFRVGILLSGKGADLREMARWVMLG
jgi:ABC-2 type transport system permease protein